MKEGLFFVGPGRMGLALGYALWQADIVRSLVYCGRRPEPPSHPLFIQGSARYVFGLERPGEETTAVFLSVPDDVLAEMAMTLAGQGDAPPGAAAFHLSGALNTDPLAPLHARGYSVGTLHPLQTVAHPVTGADLLPGSHFAVSGEPQAAAVARRLLSALGSQAVSIPVTRRPLYHSAAVLASSYVLAILAAAARLLCRAGVPQDEALHALLPLTRGTLENLEKLGPEQALTGPVPRGDLETIRLHLRALEPEERLLYRVLGRELIDLVRGHLLEDEIADELEELFRTAGADDDEGSEREGKR